MLLITLFQIGVMVTMKVQLFTSSSIATSTIPLAILSFSIIFELIGAMLAIGVLHYSRHNRSPKASHCGVGFVERLPFILISFGIVGLAIVLLMETFKASH